MMANYLRKNKSEEIKAHRQFIDRVKGKPPCPHCRSRNTVKRNEQHECRNCNRIF
jgi:ribosomal protein L37AE/L43A